MPQHVISGRHWLAALAIWASFWLAGGIKPAAAARLHVLDYQARNDPAGPLFRPRCNVVLSGQILPGDAARIQADLERFLRHPAANTPLEAVYRKLALCLNSDGGDISEAMRIAGLFFNGGRGRWASVVDDGARCLSACAVLFMKAARRDGLFTTGADVMGRYLHIGGRLGFHAPKLDFGPQAGDTITREEASRAYARALATVHQLVFPTIGVEKDPDEHPVHLGVRLSAPEDFPPELLLALLAVPHDRFLHVKTVGEAMQWGIELFGFEPPQRLTERMLIMGCLNVARVRCHSSLEQSQRFPQQCLALATWVYDAEDGRGRIMPGWEARMTSFHRTSRHGLWPPAAKSSPLAIEIFRMADPKNDTMAHCHISAHWRENRLEDLWVHTFNDLDPTAAPSLQLTADLARELDKFDPVTHYASVAGPRRIRIWKLLPFAARLADLARDPWASLDAGGDFFSRSPNVRDK